MILFWALAGAMVAASLAILLRPLLAKPPFARNADAANTARVELFNEQLAQLERDAANGIIPEQRVAEAREDLARELARALEPAPAPEGRIAQRPATGLAIVLCLSIPVMSFIGYMHYGNPATLHAEPPPLPAANAPPDVGQMVRQLESRLQISPDDGAGWQLLGRSYFVLEQYKASAAAYAKAEALLQPDADLLVASAEAHAFAAGNQLAGKPRELLTRAIRMAPEHPKGLWLSGFAALQAGHADQALEFWTKLHGLLQPQSREAQTLAKLIAEINKTGRSESQPPAALAAQSDVSAPKLRLQLRVSLDPAVAGRVTGSETVFIFAKAHQGPPMPLAAVKRLASELPLTVYLDDSSAMVPGANLSSAQRVVLSARVSGSGTPVAQSGDLEGSTGPLDTAEFDISKSTMGDSEKAIEIVIRRVVP